MSKSTDFVNLCNPVFMRITAIKRKNRQQKTPDSATAEIQKFVVLTIFEF